MGVIANLTTIGFKVIKSSVDSIQYDFISSHKRSVTMCVGKLGSKIKIHYFKVHVHIIRGDD